MKRMILAIVALITMTLSTNAMSYEQARKEALFLTDKMAYELNLTDEQYEAAYEINVDYLMGVNTVDDLYGTYWTRRNLDLSYILLDWQWNAFRAATYFYRPLYWNDGFWHFGIYARYPRRSYFYFDRPTVFVSYRGGHSWRMNGGRSYYLPRRDEFRRPDNRPMGMRDMWDRGDFRGNMNPHFEPGRGSSTRVTVNNGNRNNGMNNSYNNASSTNRNVNFGSSRTQGTFNQNRSESSYSKPNRTGSTFGSSTNGTFGSNRSTGAFGGTRNSSSASKSNGSFGGSVGTGAFGGTRSNSGTFGSSTRSSNIGGSFGGSRSSSVGGSFGGSRSNGGGSTRSAGGNGGGGFSSRR